MSEFAWTVIGTAASVVGLVVGIYVVVVATGAKKAAEAARKWARKRSLAEHLEDASQKIQQVGNFIQHDEWVAVRMRTEEIMAACRVTLTRWPNDLSVDRRNEVITASKIMRSIAAESSNGILSPGQKRKIAEAHIRASGHISSALGEARRQEERDGHA